ncbi:MAG: choline-sulfatase [Pseudomonadota bacterium]
MTKPNILIFMVDQLTGTLFPDGPLDWLHVPNLRKLADRSTRFANAYTASPLCGPSRASFMTGQMPRRTGVYDNAAEFASDIPTYAHHLRRAGYQTCLSGKMHFVGADQLHGFEERLTTDVYPADFGWTPDYRKPGERIDWWYHTLNAVKVSGTAAASHQMDYDDEVAYHATQKVYDYARSKDDRPWCMTVSFTHPHDPYVTRPKYWDLYEDCEHLDPPVPAMAYDDHDPHSKRIFDANDWQAYDIKPEDIRRSRRAYFANISYLDQKIGEVMEAMDATGQEAVILFVSDHGDMLGDRGLWFKMSFYENSARVPLMIAAPGMAPGLVETPVSTVDIAPTLAEIAGIPDADVAPWVDGEGLTRLANGTPRTAPVLIEYAAEASYSPVVAMRAGAWKYTNCALDPEQFFNLDDDPRELDDRAEDPGCADVLEQFRIAAAAQWDLEAFDAEVRTSQARRWVVYEALRQGAYTSWDHQPMKDASERYMRNHMDLNDVDGGQRFPRYEG